MKRHYHIKVHGLVQGVWYRKSTKEKADELGIEGLVLNETDGSVSISAQGKEEDLNEFILFCNIGPEQANVKSLQIEESTLMEVTGFSIG